MNVDEFFERLGAEIPELDEAGHEADPPYFLAANVHVLRVERGLTQSALAKAAGIAQPRIAEIEGGDANPRLSTLVRIARALGTSVAVLLEPPPHRRAAALQTKAADSGRTPKKPPARRSGTR